jgi:hypothetical protein
MMTDFTLMITSLMTTKYIDGKDIATHIAKMKGFCHDLMLMSCDIDDSLFTCFLHISMPPTWNYVFTGLPQSYTSAEVEGHIKDEYGIKTNQESIWPIELAIFIHTVETSWTFSETNQAECSKTNA